MPRGETFSVQVAPENGQPYTVMLEIGMEGVDIRNSEGSMSLMKIPLETISRWSMRGSRLLLFTKNSRGEEHIVTLVGSQYTIRSVLDTLTSCCMQMAEILENEEEQSRRREPVKVELPSSDQVVFWSEPEKSGWMHSQGEHIKTWRKRWFILKDGYLFRFSSPDVDSKSVPRGVVDLSQVSHVGDGHEGTGKENSICLSGVGGDTYFFVDSETAQVEWISALDNAVSRIVKKIAGVEETPVNHCLTDQLEERYSRAAERNTKKITRAYRGDEGMVNIMNYSQQRQEPEMIQIDYGSIAGGRQAPQAAPPSSSSSRPSGPGYDTAHVHQSTSAPSPPVVYGNGGTQYQAPMPQQPTPPHQYHTNTTNAYQQQYTASHDLMDFATAPPQSPEIPQWEVHYTEDGRPYYYNRTTGETTWEPQPS
ncbi:Pleckstrin-like proteiny domain-containing protein 1 [Picochlorum sp. SENEW3]|nr:Pleckstrin-like proteiny domain-containing protein 1 [Picochlorum sp. SENEW3]